MKVLLDTSNTIIKTTELRELLKSYFDAGFKMASQIKENVKSNDYEATSFFFEIGNQKTNKSTL